MSCGCLLHGFNHAGRRYALWITLLFTVYNISSDEVAAGGFVGSKDGVSSVGGFKKEIILADGYRINCFWNWTGLNNSSQGRRWYYGLLREDLSCVGVLLIYFSCSFLRFCISVVNLANWSESDLAWEIKSSKFCFFGSLWILFHRHKKTRLHVLSFCQETRLCRLRSAIKRLPVLTRRILYSFLSFEP